jgi:hypothetical protein
MSETVVLGCKQLQSASVSMGTVPTQYLRRCWRRQQSLITRTDVGTLRVHKVVSSTKHLPELARLLWWLNQCRIQSGRQRNSQRHAFVTNVTEPHLIS